jgi:N-acylneuraminate cytidylyltransferase
MFQPETFNVRSQDLEPAFFDAGQFYWGRPGAYREGVRMFGSDSVPLEIPLWRCVDIDTPDDWDRAEKLWRVLADEGPR